MKKTIIALVMAIFGAVFWMSVVPASADIVVDDKELASDEILFTAPLLPIGNDFSPELVSYKIRQGDNLWKIAKGFGAKDAKEIKNLISKIMFLNSCIKNPDLIYYEGKCSIIAVPFVKAEDAVNALTLQNEKIKELANTLEEEKEYVKRLKKSVEEYKNKAESTEERLMMANGENNSLREELAKEKEAKETALKRLFEWRMLVYIFTIALIIALIIIMIMSMLHLKPPNKNKKENDNKRD